MFDSSNVAQWQHDPAAVDVVVVSGLSPVDVDPWQAWLEARFPRVGWVRPVDGDWPDPERWAPRIDHALTREAGGRPVLALAHGFGALALVRHAAIGRALPAAAILVTPAAPHRFGLDTSILGRRLPYPATLVAPLGGAHPESPWLQDEEARTWAATWGCNLVDAGRGPRHHVGAVPGATPPWDEGEAVLGVHQRTLRALRHAA